MKILDFELELPHGFQAERMSSKEDGTCIDIAGEKAEGLSATVVERALAVGFVPSKREPTRVELERGQQRIVVAHDSRGLTIQTYDPTGLDVARVDGSAVLLSDLRLECGTRQISPLHEKHLHDEGLWSGAWELSGVSAPELLRRVLDSAIASRELRLGSVFEPPAGGRRVWSGEAYSAIELVKVRVTDKSGQILLEVDFVDNRSPLQQHPEDQ